jgi:PAS domain S-box-containing protein
MTTDRFRVTRFSGAILCLLGVYILLGWAIGNLDMVRIIRGSVAMSINTAFMFFVCGLCLLQNAATWRGALIMRSGAALVATLALAILSEHVFDIDLPIDLASVHSALGDGHGKPGRTAPNACVGFLCAGIVLFLRGRQANTTAARRIGMTLAMFTFLIGVTALLGYLLRLDAMYQVAAYNRMATATAFGISMLGMGLWSLQVRPARSHLIQDEAERITKLAAILLFVFTLATGVMSFAVLRDSFEQSAADSHSNTANATAVSVSSLIDNVALLSNSVARHPVIAMQLAQLDRNPQDQAALSELRNVSRRFSEMGFGGARIVGASGKTLFTSGNMSMAEPALSVSFGDPQDLSDLRWDQGYFLRTSHRIDHQGELVATIVTEKRLETLDALIATAQTASISTDAVMCTREDKNVLCFPSRFYKTGARVRMFDAAGLPSWPIARALLGQSGSATVKDPRGINVLTGFAPVPRHRLAIVVKTDVAELYRPLRDKLHVLLGAVLMFVAFGALLLRRWVMPLIAQIVEERQRMKAILDNSNDAFIAIGSDGRVTDWNKQAEKMLGHSAAQAIGCDLARLIIPERQRHAHTAGFARFLVSGDGPVINQRVEVSAMHADGHEVPVELSVTSFRASNVYGASAFLRDLSERKAAEQKAAEHAVELEGARVALTQSQKLEAVGKLTGGVAHDFNNVLQVVRGSLELLREESAGRHRHLKRIDTAMGAVERGAKLAAQLLAFARKQPLQPKATNLHQVVAAMDEMLQRAIGEVIAIEIVSDANLWNTLVDPNQLEHVILNLVINARDAMDGKGKLVIELANAVLDELYAPALPGPGSAQFVMLAITDTGAGMSADTIERAFEPFFSTKPEGQGTGLGLSMTYGFVKQSEGHIEIDSALGRGTSVRIYLPRSFEKVAEVVPKAAQAIRKGSETILVVEDDLAVQATTVDILAGLGYRVLKADNASMAMGIIDSGVAIDVLFTDVVMPGPLDSPELARRAKRKYPELKVLFTSGYTQDAMIRGGRLDPDVNLLGKPYGREQLCEKIRSLLARESRQERSASAAALPASALNIAFIDDNDDFRLLGVEMLTMLGHRVESFRTAEDALERACSGDFHVLLTDLSLPGMSGIALAAHVRKAHPATRIVLASGYGDSWIGRTDFAYQVLAKPFTFEQLKTSIAAEPELRD